MFVNKKYEYSSLLEYLPVRYPANSVQMADRNEVYRFKDGHASMRIKSLLVEKINEITGSAKDQWLVVFIPSSSQERTTKRYGVLAKFLCLQTGVETSMSVITNRIDRSSKHLSDNVVNPVSTFSFDLQAVAGKNIILVDDVITTGTTFRLCAIKLKRLGAVHIQGLFVARTVHPTDNTVSCVKNSSNGMQECKRDTYPMMMDEVMRDLVERIQQRREKKHR